MRLTAYGLAFAMVCAGVVGSPDPANAVENDRYYERPVYVTNRGIAFDGSAGPHVVARFTVDPAGDLVSRGEPVATGNGARGIVFAPDGRTAYVISSNEHSVYPYRVGDRSELTPLGSPVATEGAGPFGIAIAPNGRSMYTANIVAGTVSVFAVGPSGMPVLLGEPVVTGGDKPRNVSVSPDGRFLFVSHGAPPDEDPDVLIAFPINRDGTLGQAGPKIPIGATGMGQAITPDGKFLYVACALSQTVYGFRVGPNAELEPVPGSPVPAPKTPEGLAITPDGSRLYVTSVGTQPEVSPDDDGLWTFAIGADGALTGIGRRSDVATGPGLTTTPDGRHLFVSNFFANTVSAFEAATMRQLTGSPAPSRGLAPSFNAAGVLPNQGPRASFTVHPRPANRAVRFDATASWDRDGTVARYDWDFGDGTIMRAGGPRPSHVYRQPGTYRVSLVVTDNEGCSNTFVYTGRAALCTGSRAATAIGLVRVGA